MKKLKNFVENLYIVYFYIKEKIRQKVNKDVEVILVGEKHNSLLHTKLKDLLIKIYEPEAVLYECPKFLSTSLILKLIEILKKRYGIQDLLKDYTFEEYIKNSLSKLNLDKKTSSEIMKEIKKIIKEYNKENNKKISIKSNLHSDLDFLEFCNFITYFRSSLLSKYCSDEKEKCKIYDEKIFSNLFEDLKKYLDITTHFFIKNYLPTFRTFEKILNVYKKDVICVDDYKLEEKYIELIKQSLSISDVEQVLTEYSKSLSNINRERERVMAEEIVNYVKKSNSQNKKTKFIFFGGRSHIENIENYIKSYNIKTRKILLPEIKILSNRIEDDFQYIISLIRN